MSPILGIDLGTTNSVAALLMDGRPVVVPNPFGKRVTPSVVSFTRDGEVLVGEAARNQASINSKRTIFSIKRRMGTSMRTWIDNQSYLPQEICAMILRKLRRDAEAFFRREITKAVVTVPAHFNHAQRQATKDAGAIAGLEVLRIINEPTAAALAYGLHESREPQTILVYDLGGGTFDVSLLEIGGGVFEVLATCGNNRLGGDDFDRLLMEDIRKRFKDKTGVDLSADPFARMKLREEVEGAKISLSQVRSLTLSVPFISATEDGPIHLEEELTRAQFEQMIHHYIESTKVQLRRVLFEAKKSVDEIQKILLVGGSTRIPLVHDMLYRTLGIRPSISVNPDEIVALGAAIQGSILEGELKGAVLVDVTPFDLGIETEGGGFTSIIPRNKPIPIERGRLFTTPTRGQDAVEIHILQGESTKADQNVSLGRFQLRGLARGGKESRIRVTFSIDADGIVHVRAADVYTGQRKQLTVTAQDGTYGAEVEQMAHSANRREMESRAREREVDQLIRRGHELIRRARALKDSLLDDEQSVIVESIEQLNQAMLGYDRTALKACIADMEFMLQELEEVGEHLRS